MSRRLLSLELQGTQTAIQDSDSQYHTEGGDTAV